MGKALIIAEKPSVALDISKALGGFSKKDDYYESDQYVLSSAVGHLLELCVPADQEVKRGKWSFGHLPMIPSHFDLRPVERTAPRLNLLLRLIKRKEVDTLVNACDAGREGELIFRYIVQHARAEKPIRRLWLQSMTPAAIRDGFRALREDQEMRPLASAAVCRSEADWLVGINGTRAMTAFNSKSGGFQLTTVGRVQTPTLAIIVEREERIKKFVVRNYWEIHARFAATSGAYEGRWFDEKFAKEKNGDAEHKPERLWDKAKADAISAKCAGRPGIVTEESKATSQLSPLLFDLTSLQREANGRFHFSAKRTLQLAQTLYERHKAVTYPRTDSRALPEDYLETVRQTLRQLEDSGYGPLAQPILKNGWVQPNRRIFNNAKISDHFAIIPTSLTPKSLEGDEAALYNFITRRFLAVFYPPAEFLVTTRITRVENEPFKSEGKVLVSPGWLAVYGKEAQTDDMPNLAPVKPGEVVRAERVEIAACQTKPPARFNEATLLTAMEGAGKLIEDEELREAMSEKGLGTPATRASIIEGLILEEYIRRQGRELIPTPKAFSLMTLLRGIGIPELCSPELTGNWEFQLKQIEHGKLERSEFMREIAAMTRSIVEKAKGYEQDTVPGDFGKLHAPCPKCGGQVLENYKRFQCQKCDFSLWKTLAGRQLDLADIETLLSQRAVGPLQGFRSRLGRPFAATLKLSAEHKIEFDFGQGTAGENQSGPVDFTGQEPLGKCPKCHSNVYENGMSYMCEKAAMSPRACTFRTGKTILQRPIERAQIVKLLVERKTALIDKFISKKGRPFSAFLCVNADGKVGFEFAPRAPRAKAGNRYPQPKPEAKPETQPMPQSEAPAEKKPEA
jgi:DNA topoisomerase III